ncbi:MAG: S41 family peptidase [Litorimonas sp.]
MKFVLPTLGSVAAIALFAFSTSNQAAVAVERPNYDDTFEQLDLFADVLARVRNDYVEGVNDSELIEEAINGMLQSLDPHSSYLSPKNFKDFQVNTSGQYGGLGMEVTMEEGFVKVVAPIDDTPAKRSGIKAGDFITEIEGKSLLGQSLDEIIEILRGKPGEPITITVAREGVDDTLEFTLVREIIKRQIVRYEVKDGLAYIRISQFNEKASDGLATAINSVRGELGGKIPGIILDLRGNPGGRLDQSIKVSSAFLDGGEVVSTRGRKASDKDSYKGERGELAKGVPLVVLIDGASASASEIVAGAVQDRERGIIMGMTSFGKGSVQSIIPLRGGRDGAIKLTTQRYYTPDGRSIQGTGIDPDIAVSAVPNDGEERSSTRESDLPNSIENENAEDKTEVEVAQVSVDYPPEGFEIEDDYQLQKAIELLKSGTYAQKLAEITQ